VSFVHLSIVEFSNKCTLGETGDPVQGNVFSKSADRGGLSNLPGLMFMISSGSSSSGSIKACTFGGKRSARRRKKGGRDSGRTISGAVEKGWEGEKVQRVKEGDNC
jgi:hypothetical protein